MTSRDLLFRFLGDSKDLDRATRDASKGLAGTEKSASKLSQGMSGVTKAMAGFGLAIGAVEIGQFAWDAAQAAEAAQAAAASAELVLGPAMDGLRENIEETREQLGLSQADFDGLAAQLGLLTEGFGLTDEAQAEFIESMTRTGGDLAAFSGDVGNAEGAIDAMTAALRGEFDSLEQFGIKLSAAAIEEKKLELAADAANAALSDEELTILALQTLIEEKAAPAIGALAREEESLAVQTNIARAKFEDLKAQLGEKLIPAFSFLAEFLLNAFEAFERLTNSATFWDTRLGHWTRNIQEFIEKALAPLYAALDGIRQAWDNVTSAVGGAIAKVSGFKLPKLPSWIPGFAKGGTVGGPKGAPQLAVVHGGEEIVNPAMQSGSGGTTNITIVAGISDPQAVARAVVDALQLYNQTNGAIPVNVTRSES